MVCRGQTTEGFQRWSATTEQSGTYNWREHGCSLATFSSRIEVYEIVRKRVSQQWLHYVVDKPKSVPDLHASRIAYTP